MHLAISLLKTTRTLMPFKVPEILKELKRHGFAVRNRH
jgi:NTE family protein